MRRNRWCTGPQATGNIAAQRIIARGTEVASPSVLRVSPEAVLAGLAELFTPIRPLALQHQPASTCLAGDARGRSVLTCNAITDAARDQSACGICGAQLGFLFICAGRPPAFRPAT